MQLISIHRHFLSVHMAVTSQKQKKTKRNLGMSSTPKLEDLCWGRDWGTTLSAQQNVLQTMQQLYPESKDLKISNSFKDNLLKIQQFCSRKGIPATPFVVSLLFAADPSQWSEDKYKAYLDVINEQGMICDPPKHKKNTFCIDAKTFAPSWREKKEEYLNELREDYISNLEAQCGFLDFTCTEKSIHEIDDKKDERELPKASVDAVKKIGLCIVDIPGWKGPLSVEGVLFVLPGKPGRLISVHLVGSQHVGEIDTNIPDLLTKLFKTPCPTRVDFFFEVPTQIRENSFDVAFQKYFKGGTRIYKEGEDKIIMSAVETCMRQVTEKGSDWPPCGIQVVMHAVDARREAFGTKSPGHYGLELVEKLKRNPHKSPFTYLNDAMQLIRYAETACSQLNFELLRKQVYRSSKQDVTTALEQILNSYLCWHRNTLMLAIKVVQELLREQKKVGTWNYNALDERMQILANVLWNFNLWVMDVYVLRRLFRSFHNNVIRNAFIFAGDHHIQHYMKVFRRLAQIQGINVLSLPTERSIRLVAY